MKAELWRPQKGKINWCMESRFKTNKGEYTIISIEIGEQGKVSYDIKHKDGSVKTVQAKVLDEKLTFENYLGL